MAIRLGIALEGGGVRCAAQVGALMALTQAGIAPVCYTGCGTGALVAALAVTGKLSESSLRPFHNAASYCAPLRNARIGRCLETQFGSLILRDVPALAMPTIDMESGVVQVLASILPTRMDSRPWSRQALVASAVRAAMATPGVLPPVCWRSRLLCGGGQLRGTLPGILHAMGADITICIRVLDTGCARHETHSAALALCAHALAAAPPPNYDFLLTINSLDKRYGVLGRQDLQALFMLGQAAALKALPGIKAVTGQTGAKILQFPQFIQG